jgi:hypothetical protein
LPFLPSAFVDEGRESTGFSSTTASSLAEKKEPVDQLKRSTTMSRSGAYKSRAGERGKISTPVALITFIIGIAAIVVAAVFFVFKPGLKSGNTVEANSAIPFAARVDRLDGDIGIARQTGNQDQPYQGWTKATVNAPVSLGDRIHVSDGSKAAVAFSTRNYARLNPGTSVDVVSLTPRNTQLALREGAGVFDIGALAQDEVFEVGTPNGAVDFTQPGLYQVGIDDGGDTVVSVLNGTARCTGDSGSADVSKGQLLTLAATEAADAIISELAPHVAGTIVDDYYSYRYPTEYDHRYSDYSAYEADPYYYDQTYRRSASYQYVPEDDDIAGLEDLDDSGDWVDVPNYGHCWRPRDTAADWAPYRDGYWSSDSTAGLTWVSNERWGWAPYHYGRWAHVNQSWFWVPGEAVRQPVYAPALVAFVSLPKADEVGWVPLGPGDPYVPRYYDRDYRAHYVGTRDDVDRYVNVSNVVNYHDPAAVTVVSVNQFTQVITPRTALRVDPNYLASARPVVEPLAVPVVRQLAPTIDAARPSVSVPVEVQQALARPVMLRQRPVGPPVATNVAETLKIQSVPEDKAKRKLQIKNSGEQVAATNQNGLPAVSPGAKLSQMNDQDRQARISALQAQANEGNKAAKRELRQLQDQQQQQAAQQAVAQEQQQAEQRRAEKQAAKQQAQQAEQQKQAQAAQAAEQRKAEKQAAKQQAQQAEQQRQAQAAQQAEQKRAQKQAAKQQAQQTEQQRQQQANQQGQQSKADKRAARQQQAQAEQQKQQQAAQQAEQQKAQKQAARQQAQQAEQQRQQQAAQQAEQQKAQKQAARQQAQQAEQQRQQQAAQQAEQQKAQKQAARQQAQQADQRQQQQAAQQAELKKAQKRAAQEQAQQDAARQQAQQEQKRVQKQAQQQAQQQEQQKTDQQRQQQKAEKRAQRQQAEPQSQPQPNPSKAERKAEKAKKNKNENPNQ